jgi:hypothetical protein
LLAYHSTALRSAPSKPNTTEKRQNARRAKHDDSAHSSGDEGLAELAGLSAQE